MNIRMREIPKSQNFRVCADVSRQCVESDDGLSTKRLLFILLSIMDVLHSITCSKPRLIARFRSPFVKKGIQLAQYPVHQTVQLLIDLSAYPLGK